MSTKNHREVELIANIEPSSGRSSLEVEQINDLWPYHHLPWPELDLCLI